MRTLLVIDRATGETERIREDDGNFYVSVRHAADHAGISYSEALKILDQGGELVTAGFIRKWKEKN